MELKIGILPPRSDMFPSLGKNLLDGFKLGTTDLDPAQFSFQFRIEGIGNAADDGTIRTAEKMILQEEVDVLLSFCSSYILERMVSVFDAYQKPLIHIDLGSNGIKSRHLSPYVAFHSLNVLQSAYAAGAYAAKTHGKKALLVASFYDGGYQHTAALVKGFTDHGGFIVNNYVGPMDYKAETYENMIQFIEASEAEVVFLLFSFKEGDKVLHALSQSALNGKLPFVTLPMLTDESFNHRNHHLQQVTSVASWSFDEMLPAMETFVQKANEAFQSPPNIMHLLGYELGLVITTLLKTYGNIPKEIVSSLQNLTIDSPRGILNYTSNGESQVDSYKVRTFNFNEVRYHNTVIDTMDSSLTATLHAAFEDVDYAGWQNPYICT
ncbi:MAG TPA: ABC transporter substrate-binding protein [Flavobacteriaceae bacterium]|nr:ABC transporter substrate-binding protein [Flavobacteriaceae bacterium]HQU66476.1 ABC transporter substrate-binding protein [Flavobacteriaceae bacterium]